MYLTFLQLKIYHDFFNSSLFFFRMRRNCPNSFICSRGIILGNARKIRRDVNVGSFAIFSYLLRSSSARCFKESIRALSSSAFSCLASSTFSRITSARALIGLEPPDHPSYYRRYFHQSDQKYYAVLLQYPP